MADTVNPIDPFQAITASRLHAEEREFKGKVIADIADLKGLITNLIEKLESKE